MKTKLRKLSLALMAGTLMMTSFSSCGDDVTREGDTIINGSYIISRDYEVKEADWKWNDIAGRYEYTFYDVEEIDNDLYEFGTIVGTVFIQEKIVENGNETSFEVQKTLPLVVTHNDFLPNIYTETISYDIFYGGGDSSGAVTFYIQSSDLTHEKPFVDDYMFKVAYVWVIQE